MIFHLNYVVIAILVHIATCSDDVWEQVPCDTEFQPENCDFNQIPLLKVEDFDRCGPAVLNLTVRNYFLGAAGRRVTYNNNKKVYKRIRILPQMLRDVSKSSLEISTLGQKVSFPIGFSPVALQKLAHPMGEIATVRAISNMGTVMVLSSYGSTKLEEVAEQAREGSSHLWMQTYIFKNRSLTVDIVRRAEKAGFEAIVATIDSPISGTLSCNGREEFENINLVNLPVKNGNLLDPSLTFKDITWLKSITKLPVITKGILSAPDAVKAVLAGAKGILVSNHGGRQMDSAPATIDVLPDIVDAVKRVNRRVDVYVDGGIRNGWDVYKAIASGAKMAFVGRPIVWGLAKGGESGVREVMNILRREFEETMILSGASNPSQITRQNLFK